jgi:hypothetical protein
LGLVFVEVKHRHWLRAVECLLASDQGAPLLDIHDCHFGHWQESDGRGRYGAHPEFPALTAVHAHLHALAGELIEAHAQGQQADVQTRLAELHALSDELIEKLRGLARGADKG